MCPDWGQGLNLQSKNHALDQESNLQPSCVWADALTTEHGSQGSLDLIVDAWVPDAGGCLGLVKEVPVQVGLL